MGLLRGGEDGAGRWAGGAAYAVLAAALAFGPWAWTRTWSTGPVEVAADDPGERAVVGVGLLECRLPDGWEELAVAVSRLPGPPAWEDLRRMMEVRGLTAFRYSLRLRWFLDDGGVDELTYNRTPYLEPFSLGEFLGVLRCGDEPGEPDGRPIRYLNLLSHPTKSLGTTFEALIDAPQR